MDSKQAKETLISVAALGVSLLVKNSMENLYHRTMEGDTSKRHAPRDANWGSVAGWTIAAGLSVVAMKMLMNRVDNKYHSVKESWAAAKDDSTESAK